MDGTDTRIRPRGGGGGGSKKGIRGCLLSSAMGWDFTGMYSMYSMYVCYVCSVLFSFSLSNERMNE